MNVSAEYRPSSSSSSSFELDQYPRTSLLLNATQMMREKFPAPSDELGYVPTKENYAPVTDRSPMFALNCEMAYDERGDIEIVWLVLVNEYFEVFQEIFVKTDQSYLELLKSCGKTLPDKLPDNPRIDLKDIQTKISEFLPKDAILCGYHLNKKLHKLKFINLNPNKIWIIKNKMFHPYVISVNFMYRYVPNSDLPMKHLRNQYFGECTFPEREEPSVEAVTSMRLTLLKLRPRFDLKGENGKLTADVNGSLLRIFGMTSNDLSEPKIIRSLLYYTGVNIVEHDFFDVLQKYNVSNAFIDRTERCVNENTSFYLVHDNDIAFERLKNQLNEVKFTWTQFYIDSADDREMNEHLFKCCIHYVNAVYQKLKPNSILMIAFTSSSGDVLSNETNRHGRCFFLNR